MGRLLRRRAPLVRGPEPLSGARLGACTERSVGASAGVPASVPQGAHAAQSRVGSTSVDSWSWLPPQFRTIQEARDVTDPFIWVQAGGTNAPHIPYLTPWLIQLPLGN